MCRERGGHWIRFHWLPACLISNRRICTHSCFGAHSLGRLAFRSHRIGSSRQVTLEWGHRQREHCRPLLYSFARSCCRRVANFLTRRHMHPVNFCARFSFLQCICVEHSFAGGLQSRDPARRLIVGRASHRKKQRQHGKSSSCATPHLLPPIGRSALFAWLHKPSYRSSFVRPAHSLHLPPHLNPSTVFFMYASIKFFMSVRSSDSCFDAWGSSRVRVKWDASEFLQEAVEMAPSLPMTV